MRYDTSALFFGLLMALNTLSACDLTVVPYPKNIEVMEEKPFLLHEGFTIAASSDFASAAELFVQDAAELYGVQGRLVSEKGDIELVLDASYKEEAYELLVSSQGIILKASNYNAMVMGLTTLLQMVDVQSHELGACKISDEPKFGYRGFMIDVARQWTELETIKQMVDLCRWYKMRYVHLHISDAERFAFQSKLYPMLAHPTQSYSQDELKDLVAYAKQRGVIIIPEFDLPGHCRAILRACPELFGRSECAMLDVVNPEAVKAVQGIAREMMDVFYTSPYFHIGADEVWLAAYEKEEHVKEFLANNKDKYDNAHDLYLQFIVDMHEFVKSQGKQTLVWESFGGTGSAKVQIPKDIIVFAWESLYQRPESLVKNGYTIINASVKPGYTSKGHRWSPEYIYQWNPRRWENAWEVTPSYKNPIQLPDDTQLMGVQSCAWELFDYDQLLTAHQRIPAFSEQGWNDEAMLSYESFAARAKQADEKIMRLIFPATEELMGFKSADPSYLDHNRIYQFTDKASAFFKPINPSDSIYYTTDGSFPKVGEGSSQLMTQAINLDASDVLLKMAMYDDSGMLRGYKICFFQLKQLEYSFDGIIRPRDEKRDFEILRFPFSGQASITIKNLRPNTTLHYTLDGQRPSKDSPVYSAPLVVDDALYNQWVRRQQNGEPTHLTVQAASIGQNGSPEGHVMHVELTKVEQ